MRKGGVSGCHEDDLSPPPNKFSCDDDSRFFGSLLLREKIIKYTER